MTAIQIKQVPPGLHQRLRERARERGISLSQYALSVLERDISVPSTREWLQRIAADETVHGLESGEIADAIAAGRAQRDERLLGAHADRD